MMLSHFIVPILPPEQMRNLLRRKIPGVCTIRMAAAAAAATVPDVAACVVVYERTNGTDEFYEIMDGIIMIRFNHGRSSMRNQRPHRWHQFQFKAGGIDQKVASSRSNNYNTAFMKVLHGRCQAYRNADEA